MELFRAHGRVLCRAGLHRVCVGFTQGLCRVLSRVYVGLCRAFVAHAGFLCGVHIGFM